ncbi:hypothetical protein ASPVEDRAFT_46605 [Aspergillus versicolor CBS 583.65]|uniref:Uncharacterized protein n=1 Tax=Aspergillus versicolor CBS 583.65 TaxID=1036611 RepID=A0A1L9Q0F7_ASPVE|nr:uncharacterized protein ASPVEDRAFT_46605 [Aspergillus versicolor CBS 583.65]OJJ07254.1 hypothetical protein ASPVEDRAFT_46605 [Aspergillus versicolor CBS 583.65]
MNSNFTEKMGYNGYPAYQPPFQPYQQPYPQYSYQPAQPYYTQGPPQQQYPGPRAYEVTFTSWSGRHMRITEETREGPLAYTADLHNRKPHIIFQAEGTANLPATVTYHNFRSTIDLSINGADLSLRSESKWKHQYAFDSLAIQGKHLVWKSRSCSMNMECTDESGNVYAKFTAHNKGWSGKKAGRLEIFPAAAVGGKGLADELVVTCLANVYLILQRTTAANSAASASAGAAAATSVSV